MMSSTVTMPGGAAELVGDHGQRGALPLHVGQQVVERLGLGHDQRLAHERLERRLGTLAHQRLGEPVRVHDALDAVGVVVLDHEQARVAGADAAAQRRSRPCRRC